MKARIVESNGKLTTQLPRYTQGQFGQTIRFKILNNDNTVFDLTNFDVQLNLELLNEYNEFMLQELITITDAQNGLCEYTFAETELFLFGSFNCFLKIFNIDKSFKIVLGHLVVYEDPSYVSSGTIIQSSGTTDQLPEGFNNLYFTTQRAIDAVTDQSVIENINHDDLMNTGSNSHQDIDNHISDSSIHFIDSPADGKQYVRKDNGWEEVDVSWEGLSGDQSSVDLSGFNNDLTITENQITDLDKYTQNEVNNLLNDKVDNTDFNSHTGDSTIHFTQEDISITENQITDLDKYTQNEVNNLLNDKVDNTDFNSHTGDSTIHFTQGDISITESQISDLQEYSLDNEVVKLTGNQSIDGKKTFNDPLEYNVLRTNTRIQSSGNININFDNDQNIFFNAFQSFDLIIDFLNRDTGLSKIQIFKIFIVNQDIDIVRNVVWPSYVWWVNDDKFDSYNLLYDYVVTLEHIGAGVIKGSYEILREKGKISRFMNDVGYLTEVTSSDVTQHQGDISITESQISDLDKYTQQQVNNLLNDKVDNTDFNSHTGDSTIHFTQNQIEIANTQVTGLGTASTRNVGTSDGNLVEVQSNGKISESVIPSIALTEVYTVADDTARDNLTAETGDIAIVDNSAQAGGEPATYIYDGNTWQKLKSPTDAVSSVFGRTGTVIAESGDYSFNQINGTIVTNQIEDNQVTYGKLSSSVQNSLDLADSALQDYTVTEGDVTQHQDAIEIVEAQVTDLDKYTQAEVNSLLDDKLDGEDFVAHTDDTTIHFTQGDISITESQISDFGNYLTEVTNSDLTGLNISELNNDSNYITSAEAPVQSVNNQTDDVVLTFNDIDDVDVISPNTNDLVNFDGTSWTTTDTPTVKGLQLDTANPADDSTGRIIWNSGDEVPQFTSNGVTVDLSLEMLARCRNVTGSTIPRGTAVCVVGASAQRISIAPSDRTQPGSACRTLGITLEEIADNNFGKVSTFGLVRGLNTDIIDGNEGDELFVGPTPGSLTSTPPDSPARRLSVGYLVTKSANQGRIFVTIKRGVRTDEIDDVQKVGSYVDGDVLRYVGTNGRWENIQLGSAADSNVEDFATSAQGDLADSALQPGDNISELTNNTGFITDYTVTEGDVTQHQGALNITESQISDLGNYIEDATADGEQYVRKDNNWEQIDVPSGSGEYDAENEDIFNVKTLTFNSEYDNGRIE